MSQVIDVGNKVEGRWGNMRHNVWHMAPGTKKNEGEAGTKGEGGVKRMGTLKKLKN